MVRIKRVYESAAKDDGYRVLVDRLWPRGMKKEAAKIDLWMKDIAPSDQLRKSFHHDLMNWSDFQKKYQAELKTKKEWLAQLKKLEKERGTLTLLFGSRDAARNQAAIIAEALKKN